MPLAAIDLAHVLRELATTLRGVLDRRIDIQLDLSPGPLWLECDRQQLEDAVIDLVRLARDAIADEGVVTLSAHRSSRGGSARAPARLLLKVACSVWQDDMPHSNLASRFALAHGASLTVAGLPGQGRVTTLSLPLQDAASDWVQRERRQLQGRG